eukprot:862724-Rhodomonas_salina.2
MQAVGSRRTSVQTWCDLTYIYAPSAIACVCLLTERVAWDQGCSNGGQAADEDDVCAFDRSAIGYCDVDPLMDGCPVVLPYVDQECGASDQVKIRVK